MRSVSAALLLGTLFAFSAAQAQTPSATPGGSFEKKNFNYSPWTKGLFSEVVTVTHPGKMIFLAGVGAEDENGERGTIRISGTSLANAAMPMTRSSVSWRLKALP
jgi:hypothetical protein